METHPTRDENHMSNVPAGITVSKEGKDPDEATIDKEPTPQLVLPPPTMLIPAAASVVTIPETETSAILPKQSDLTLSIAGQIFLGNRVNEQASGARLCDQFP